MKLYIKILCCCLCIASSACVHAQIIISGVVRNAAENPLQGVNVLLKEGTKHSILKYTSTDTQGKFSFSMPEQKNLYLVFSSIGHEKKSAHTFIRYEGAKQSSESDFDRKGFRIE
ncbi:carboxypeptidase-like regulatory domain-containing protein [Porphyromonas macacae]|uniref:carboxypeptidase-like regulatory domain-containing protein n=1 Tax=Porphyromonas macacae TaxID=28115 RepID=UPI0009DFE639